MCHPVVMLAGSRVTFFFLFSKQASQDADHLHYAALKVNKATRSRRQQEDTLSQCVYSSVKQ